MYGHITHCESTIFLSHGSVLKLGQDQILALSGCVSDLGGSKLFCPDSGAKGARTGPVRPTQANQGCRVVLARQVAGQRPLDREALVGLGAGADVAALRPDAQGLGAGRVGEGLGVALAVRRLL